MKKLIGKNRLKGLVDGMIHESRAPKMGSPSASLVPPDIKGMRILVVDDSAVARMIAADMLTGMEAVVEQVENGQQAVACFLAEGRGYDYILMDIQMPVMDGLEATRRIRSSGHPRAGQVPIVAMSASVFKEDVARMLEAGMDAHIPKPFQQRQMEQALAEAKSKHMEAQR